VVYSFVARSSKSLPQWNPSLRQSPAWNDLLARLLDEARGPGIGLSGMLITTSAAVSVLRFIATLSENVTVYLFTQAVGNQQLIAAFATLALASNLDRIAFKQRCQIELPPVKPLPEHPPLFGDQIITENLAVYDPPGNGWYWSALFYEYPVYQSRMEDFVLPRLSDLLLSLTGLITDSDDTSVFRESRRYSHLWKQVTSNYGVRSFEALLPAWKLIFSGPLYGCF
jgi:hypothetical protein